jgi:4-hydroxy-2-oxoheptanedioate aldolase
MRVNRLRELLDGGKPTIGTHVLSTWPAVVEILGQTGEFDYVELVGQYAPHDLYSLENFARAVDLFDHMTSMMKVDQEPRAYLAERAIGSGIQNILFADARSVEDAEACVRAVRAETPEAGGTHGAGMRRDVGYVVEPGSADFVQALDRAVVALMVEKKGAVENLEEMLSIAGVDMVQFGPADYSMSIGLPGQWDHPLVKEAERRTIELALKAGVAPRAEISNLHEAQEYIDLGVRHFSIGTDLTILSRWWRENGAGLRRVLSRA